jgi:hypothetical protein
MWCRHCQSDVVAEALSDNRRVLCATCRTDITPATAPHADPGKSARDPRELLARWAEEDATDPLGPLYHGSARRDSLPLSESHSDTSAPPAQTVLPFTAPAAPPFGAGPPPTASTRSAIPTPPVPRGTSADTPPRRVMPLPSVYRHWSPSPGGDVRDTDGDSPRDEAETNRLRIVGQMFAYLGVLTLFVGSVLVLLGHFGNLANYSPTGWIIATAGQMLLFLGVVTLVAAGLEQIQEAWRRSHTDMVDRFARLERTTADALERFAANDGPIPEESGSTTAGVNRGDRRRSREQRIAELTAELERLRAA